MKIINPVLPLAFALIASASGKGEDELDGKRPRIIGGSDVEDNEFPTFIEWNLCGATLIHNDIALSAAHCDRDRGVALVGASEKDSPIGGAVYTTVVNRVKHPDFDVETRENDILVMKLGGWMQKNVTKLNKKTNKRIAGEVLTVVGFGRTSEEGSSKLPKKLQKANVLLIENTECLEIYQDEYDEGSMMCAADEGTDSCNGDSGGPLFDEKGIQVGIVSWGKGCAKKEYPGVYASVGAGYKWIEKQICSLSDNPPASCKDQKVVMPTRVRIDIHYDGFPLDIEWELKDEDGNRVAKSEAGNEECLLSKYVEVSNGEYEFKITDEYGDGLTIPDGNFAVFEIKPDGSETKIFDGDGKFSKVKEKFSIGPDPGDIEVVIDEADEKPDEEPEKDTPVQDTLESEQDNPAPSQNSVQVQGTLVLVKVEIDIDDEPREVGWEITDADGNVVIEHEAGIYNKKKKFSHFVELEYGDYIFTLENNDEAEGQFILSVQNGNQWEEIGGDSFDDLSFLDFTIL